MILVCGEALIDFVPVVASAAEPESTAGGLGARLYEARPGGSPYTTAVAIGRLGTPVALLARFSTADGFGRQLRQHAASSGVELDLAVDTTDPTTLALVAVDADGSATYTFHAQGTADWGWRPDELPSSVVDDTLAVHTGSIALGRAPSGDVIEDFLRRAGEQVTISIDPNIRPHLIGPRAQVCERVDRWVHLAGILKVSSEDLEWLYPDEGRDVVLRRWLEGGPRLVVVTDGSAGATAHLPGTAPVRRPARAVDVADTVGAGDTTAGALLAWLADHDRLAPAALAQLTAEEAGRALEFALTAAAVTVTRSGADPPWRHEL